MLEELLNSKMFWLFAALISGIVLGVLSRKISGSQKSYMTIGMPLSAVFLTALILQFVKLNVAYFDIKYSIIGIAAMLVIALALGYIMFLNSNKKVSFFYNFSFLYTGLCLVIFYVFFKSELKINTTACPESKDIYLLLKNEDAGYYEINEEGIGYVGGTLFNDGFRPKFLKAGIDNGIYNHTPIAVELPSKAGVIHALWFKSNAGKGNFSIDELLERGVVKAGELKTGDLKDQTKKD